MKIYLTFSNKLRIKLKNTHQCTNIHFVDIFHNFVSLYFSLYRSLDMFDILSVINKGFYDHTNNFYVYLYTTQ